MDPVRQQYETFPYPERDPKDEARRLIVGSPSAPREIDHFLFRGARDWSRPFRALVAGGGTGDGLVQLAQLLADAGRPAEITYLDMSQASRAVAEARIEARGLTSVRFVTGDLLEAPALAPEGGFDYIDCCGVLHHLPDPQAGFDALSRALSQEGGMGLMVYAPYGRTGVYALQDAFAALTGSDAPAERVRLARAAIAALPPTNWFLRNEHLSDHETGDAGLYDLLLHGRDRPFGVEELIAALEGAGLGLVSFLEPARYDPLRLLPRAPEFAERVGRLDPPARWALAERLAGNMRMHVAYVARAARADKAMAAFSADARPHLNGVEAPALARQISRRGMLKVEFSGIPIALEIPRRAAAIAAHLDGRRTYGEIARGLGLDWFAFAQAGAPLHRALTSVNLLHCSRGLA